MCGFWRGHFKSFYLSASQLSTSCVLGGFGEKDGKEDLGVGKPDADECFDHTKDRSSTDCSGWCSPDPGVGAPEVEAIVSTQPLLLWTQLWKCPWTQNTKLTTSIESCENVHNSHDRVCSENVAQHINNYLSVHWHHPRSHALSSELSKSEWGPRALTPYVISACQQAGGCFEKLTKIGEPVIPEKIHKYSKNPDTVIHSAL